MADEQLPQIVLNLKSGQKLYCFFPLVRPTLKFKVKTDKDIYVCLTPSFSLNDPRYYEINIGGWDNSKSTFAKDKADNYLATHDGSIIERGKFNDFWIRIIKEQGVIEVGKGETHTVPFMRVADPDFVEMEYFGMSSFNDAAGEWIMDRDVVVD